MRNRQFALAAALLALVAATPRGQVRFDDVVRNLRNPDPKARMASVRLLREAKYPEAIVPMAPLVNDPLDDIQLEAIAAELAFYLVEDVQPRRRVALVVEVRHDGRAPAAFERGPLAVWPRPVPAELTTALLKAIEDEHPRVRLEAIYTLGTIGRAPLSADDAQHLVNALDHYDPAIRAAAARVIGRLQVASAGDALLKAVNDSQAPVRYAAMRALGDIRDARAVKALTEQFTFYGKGEGAWSALDALARIAHASSVPLFQSRLGDRDQDLRRAAAEGLARAGDSSSVAALATGAVNDSSEMVRAAMAFALQKLGRNYIARLADLLNSGRTAPQVAGYFLELGPDVAPALLPHLKDPAEAIRANVAVILGELGDRSTIAALEPLTTDKDGDVAEAARRAIERIKMRG